MAFLYESTLSDSGLASFVSTYGLVPAELTYALDHGGIGVTLFLPLFTSMFLHGGWLHLIGNMLFLYVFGDNVEDRFGHAKYFLFYFVAGIAAAIAQWIFNVASVVPMIGASGAIGGVLGAYILMFPRAKVVTLLPIFVFFKLIELPAFMFLGIWFLMQMLSASLTLGIGGDAGGVAWWAHIGGFAAGVVLVPFFRKSAWK